jgi:hypothetical protein
MWKDDEALQGRAHGSLARKQIVPATDEKAQKGSEARTDARVSHRPEGRACIECIECIYSEGWCEWKGVEKGLRD